MSARVLGPRPLACGLAVLATLAPLTPALAAPSVTVYTRDLGFVRERRTLQVSAPHDTVRITDVSRRLDFSSVRLDPGPGAKVRRLAYRFDLAGGDQLLESAIGRTVRVTLREQRVAEGLLLAADGSWLVVRSDDGAVLTLARASVDEVRLARPPADLSLRPTLEAVIEPARAGRVEAELSYLTGGLSWNAEHTVVRQGERRAEWSTAVTVENTTGVDFVNAELKLVAGEPRRETPAPIPYQRLGAAMAMEAKEQSADLSEQAFAEYHLYSLGRPATLRDRESQSLTMIEPHDVKTTPRYLYRGGDPRGVASQIEVMNTKESGLGMPLPGGRVRFYEADPAGALQFTGETRIAHTPEGEKVTLEIGYAFDLAAERRDVSSRKISDREREQTVEIKLRNRKKTDVSIVVEERVGGDIEVTQKTHDFVRKDANTLEFTVPVPAGKEVAVRYTVRVRY